jgi:uncharacterized protein (TIGR00251 family)
MILNIKVIPNAKKQQIKKDGQILKVYLNAPAVEGKANKALIEFLARHFSVRKSSVKITKGEKSRDKVINIVE